MSQPRQSQVLALVAELGEALLGDGHRRLKHLCRRSGLPATECDGCNALARLVALAAKPLPHAESWTERSIVEWFTRCDRCKRRRLRARYHEVHGKRPEPDQHGLTGCWWRECLACFIATLRERLHREHCREGGDRHGDPSCAVMLRELGELLT
jgi:hypothetical protein